jgi:two-component system, chemotaxis family, protein-glutamate methylesterase/glutaminase
MEAHRLIQATCPECRGPLSEVRDGAVVEYRCLVGHRYSPLSLLIAHSDTEERALWAAALALEEAEVIANEVSTHLAAAAETLRVQGAEKRQQANAIRAVLDNLRPFTTGRSN